MIFLQAIALFFYDPPCPILGQMSATTQPISQTHLLTLIPKGMTLEKLEKLIVKSGKIGKSFCNDPVKESYWILVTNDVIPSSRDKSLEEQQDLAEQFAPQGYELCSCLDLCVSLIAAHHVQKDLDLYTDVRPTWTRCFEQPLIVGAFGSNGLQIDHVDSGARWHIGIGLMKKLSSPKLQQSPEEGVLL